MRIFAGGKGTGKNQLFEHWIGNVVLGGREHGTFWCDADISKLVASYDTKTQQNKKLKMIPELEKVPPKEKQQLKSRITDAPANDRALNSNTKAADDKSGYLAFFNIGDADLISAISTLLSFLEEGDRRFLSTMTCDSYSTDGKYKRLRLQYFAILAPLVRADAHSLTTLTLQEDAATKRAMVLQR